MYSLRNTLKPSLILLYCACLLVVFSGCAVTRIVPLQAGRIAQTETYIQIFSFFDQQLDNLSADENRYERQLFIQTQRMDEVFKQMIGEKNWQNLKDLYGLGNLRKELLEKKIYIKGFANLIFYPDPFDERYFSVDGFGRYFLIREKTEAILLSGDYSFSDQQHSIAELQKGEITLDIKLFLIQIPGLVTYYHEAPLIYKFFIDNRLAEHNIFSLDYSKKHLAYLIKEDDELTTASPFATIIFTPPVRPAKLWDFRGIQFMRRDYEQLMKKHEH